MEQTEAPVKRKQPANLYNSGQGGRQSELPNVPWEAIRSAVESGVSMVKVAKRWQEHHPKGYKGLLEVIKKRSLRGGWMVPRTLMGEARERAAELGVDVPAMSQTIETAPSDREKVGTLIVESLAEMGESGSLIAAQLALGQLRDASKNPAQLAPLVDVKDLGAAMKVVRTAAGMDRQAAPVSFNLWGGPMSQPGTSRDITGDIRDVAGSALQEWTDE